MTFRRVAAGSGHSYVDEGTKVPGVTTLLSAGLPHPAFVKAATKACAAYVIDNWDDLLDLPASKRGQAVEDAWWKRSRKAMARGRDIHDMADRLGRGEPVEAEPETVAPAQQYASWLDANEVDVLHSECPVINRRWGYAGTFDLLADIAGETWLLDIKTGDDVWPEVALQLAAYRNAEAMLVDGIEVPMPQVMHTGVVHVGGDFAHLRNVDTGEAVFKAFLYVCQVAKWVQATDTFRGGTSPVGQPILRGPSRERLTVVREP
jgi:hypothetical protein